MRKLAISLVGTLIVLASSPAVHAKIYLFEDFESYTVGGPLDAGDLWEQHRNAVAPGEASDEVSYPPGGKSGYFPGQSGFGHSFAEDNLPEEYTVSFCYYHDPKADPPPHYMMVIIKPYPEAGAQGWLGVGTVETVPDTYSLRDKAGTGQETDTGVERKDWVNILFNVTKDGTGIIINGENVYTSPQTSFDGFWFGDVWSGAAEAYIDSIVIADTPEEATEILAVRPEGKLSTAWAALKREH